MQGMTARKRRDQLRETWVPRGPALRQLEVDQGIVIRFIIGRTCAPPPVRHPRLSFSLENHSDPYAKGMDVENHS